MTDFGTYLRAAREARGLSRQQVADASRLSYAYLSQLESGKKSSPSARALHQLATGVGIAVEELAEHAGVPLDRVSDGSSPSRPAPVPPRDEATDGVAWHRNPEWVRTTSISTGAAAPRGRSELSQARAELLPALSRLLSGYSPATRMALLAELQSAAVADLTGDHS